MADITMAGTLGGGGGAAGAHSHLDAGGAPEKSVGTTHRSGREIIQIQVGKAGCGMGHEFLRDLVEEHNIEYENEDLRGTFFGQDYNLESHADVFFEQGAPHRASGRHRWVPRCILVDLNMQDLAQITSGPLGHLYRPENIVGSDEGSGNCYAKAFHIEGADIADYVLDIVRKEAEKCNCLQGVQFTHSISGGTGSGLTGLMMQTLFDYFGGETRNVLMQNFALVPSIDFSDVVLEPYNALLGWKDLFHYCDQAFIYDNKALSNICRKSLKSDVPKRQEMNNIIALCMSGITSGLRFKGPLNADLRKMNTNLAPFRKCHFLVSSFAPLHNAESGPYRQKSALDLAQQMLQKECVTCNCDPLALAMGEKPGARILASWASWRGNFRTQEVDRILYDMSKPSSRYDVFYPDWIPHPVASNVCSQGHCEHGESVVYVANNTAITEVMDHTSHMFDRMYEKKSFFHVFEGNGIEEDEFVQAKHIMDYLKAQYVDYARHPDKILDGKQINHDAVASDEQTALAEEILDLQVEEMEIVIGKGA